MSNYIFETRNLCKTYTGENEVVALKDINISIEKGDIFGIIGLSGAGKSTLVRCLNLLEKPTDGTVFFDGKDLSSMSKKELLLTRQEIGMIFQNFNLLNQRTTIGNICYPLEIAGKLNRQERTQRAYELLDIVGLKDKDKAYPSQLSGGQKQRIAIARALANNPKVILCDEATSALDPTTTQSILSLLKDINRKFGVTIVIITHEMKVIEKICNKVAVIDNSVIAEQGEVSDVFVHPKSSIAKKLILPEGTAVTSIENGSYFRLVFDGTSTFEPIISNLIMECRVPINIISANTKIVDDKTFGQMVVQLPSDETSVSRVLSYLEGIKNIYIKKEEANSNV